MGKLFSSLIFWAGFSNIVTDVIIVFPYLLNVVECFRVLEAACVSYIEQSIAMSNSKKKGYTQPNLRKLNSYYASN